MLHHFQRSAALTENGDSNDGLLLRSSSECIEDLVVSSDIYDTKTNDEPRSTHYPMEKLWISEERTELFSLSTMKRTMHYLAGRDLWSTTSRLLTKLPYLANITTESNVLDLFFKVTTLVLG